MAVVVRAQWGARPPREISHDIEPWGIAVHYSASNADEQANHANCPGRVLAIQRYHMDVKHWADIAYSFLVCKHGDIYVGRGWDVRTAANGTNPANDHYHAVCFLGDDTANRDDVTPAGRIALASVVLNALRQPGHGDKIEPHSAFVQTLCPGDELRLLISRLRRLVAG